MKKRKTSPKSVRSSAAKSLQAGPVRVGTAPSIASDLLLGQLRSEKCELKEAHAAYLAALSKAKRARDLRGTMEAISGLLRLSSEALDEPSILKWEDELDELMAQHPKQIPPMAWYCKGAIARFRNQDLLAQRYFHRYLRAARKDPQHVTVYDLFSSEEAVARGWVMLAVILHSRGRSQRALWLANEILRRNEKAEIRSLRGILYLLLGNIAERGRRIDVATQWYQKAHASFLGSHNWFYHLYVLYGYARLARLQQNYAQAYWYLDLIDKAARGSEFGLLRRELATERVRLEQDAVDLLIDSRQCLIKTREGGQVSLRKQYVLLHILEALSSAHGREGTDTDRGLSKAEIIEHVWHENYRPEAHDNKLYYNINRLRKLIEPDIRNPQYLLNWKEGYRLAPGLRIHFVGGAAGKGSFEGGEAK